uniref:Sideroflexin 2 n=1 Tax=Petromyzon marinus TaxID=7757 RepID=S4RDD0_PETMA
LYFVRSIPAVVLWQWINQSFNALVNYTWITNPSMLWSTTRTDAASPITSVHVQIGMAYVTATSAALVTAVGLNLSTKSAPPLVARWVPFVAVAAANCVNIPMMRQQEIIKGIVVTDENGNELGHSRKAAVKGIAQVVVSRITIAAPGMIILPIVMQRLEKYAFMQRKRFLLGPIQLVLLGCFLTFMVPAGCALYPQTCSMEVSHLEPELQKSIVDKHGDAVARVFFNKGL